MLRRITAAQTLAVSVDQAKQRLRIETDDDDDDIRLLILAAMGVVEKSTGLILQPSSWEYIVDGVPWDVWDGPLPFPWERFDGALRYGGCGLTVPASPVRDITGVTYLDVDGVEQTIAPSNYSWQRTETGARVIFAKDYVLPQLFFGPQALRVQFDAGFEPPGSSGSGDDAELALPEMAKMAVLFLVGTWNEYRESVAEQRRAPFEVPQTFDRLVASLKVFR